MTTDSCTNLVMVGWFVSLLAVVVVHWTRQIKEALASQEAMESVDNCGPLEEIEFWRERCEDLSGLTTQLNKPDMLHVVHIIERAKSSFVTPFRRLSHLIQARTDRYPYHMMTMNRADPTLH